MHLNNVGDCLVIVQKGGSPTKSMWACRRACGRACRRVGVLAGMRGRVGRLSGYGERVVGMVRGTVGV